MNAHQTIDGSSRLRLSIALACCNGAKHLQEQCDSFVAQTRLPDEVVIADDRSDDGTIGVLAAFRDRAPFPVRIIQNSERLGIVRNFENAIRHSDGDIIFLSDQDDVWHPEKLAQHEAVYQSRPDVGLVFNDLDVVDAALNPLGTTTFGSQRVLPKRQARMSRGHGFELLVKRSMINGCALSFRAQYREFICPMADRLWLHDEWIALIVSALAKLGPINRSLGSYRQHGQQTLGASSTFQGGYQHDRVAYIDAEVSRIDQAIDRLKPIQSRLLHRSFLRFIEGKRTHLLRRRNLGASRLGRLPTIAREVANGNYKRYSRWLKLELTSDLRDR